ncbi:MAG: hypothetical protein JEZ01_06170 [Labilibaculum sp.]|nr:hypothetical protein [Labilibaculum sp.]MBI9057340.1 hypothetical protein [Labilibaculum sp.]
MLITRFVIEANTRIAFRKGDWLMILVYKGPGLATKVNIELGNSKGFQLYNLKEDISQQNNLAEVYLEILKEMYDAFIVIQGENYKKNTEIET